MDRLKLLESLALNNNLSKSEMNVVYFCYKKGRTSKEIAVYLGWASPNVARLLLSMYNKGFLERNLLEEDKKTYIYITNDKSELLHIK
ncbi:MarR family transcriptional regulator [Liquorilactobacillus sicerae]|uniref:MarR family transcriptional regulator n=1 Tax=Liquorilactobacillus sicerae TaxID=1416943 RepID=UPI0024811772|nr:helix-turn-helix domain-containing protein [Liquorilactobacillus sicerae]